MEESFIIQAVGAMCGLALSWSLFPMENNQQTRVFLLVGVIVAAVATPITFPYISEYIDIPQNANGMFMVATINGLLIAPVARKIREMVNKDG